MNREIAWQFAVDPSELDDLRIALYTMGAAREGEYLMPIIVYSNPMKPDIYIRIRHEGKHVSFTVKTDLKAEFPIEHEIEVEPTQKNIAWKKSGKSGVCVALRKLSSTVILECQHSWRLMHCPKQHCTELPTIWVFRKRIVSGTRMFTTTSTECRPTE